MVHSTLLHLSLTGRLTLELFIEGEDCFLAGRVDVACSSAAGREFGGCGWEAELEEGGGTAGCGT
jgi:hypothetical protein